MSSSCFTNTFGVGSVLTSQRTTGTVNPRPSINVANPLDTEHVPTRRGKHIIQSSNVLHYEQWNLHTDNCSTNINFQLRYMRSTSKTIEHATRSHNTISMGDCGSFFSPFQSSILVEDSNTRSQYCHGESSSRQVVNGDIGSDNKHGDDIDDENDNHIQGEYWDIGDPEFECRYCGAQVWYDERLKKACRQKNPKFGLCCGQCKVKLHVIQQPPDLIFDLLNNRHSKSKRDIVAAIIIGDINPDYDQRDIVVDERSKGLQYINEYHPSYLALRYPLLFTYGEDGFRNDVPHAMGRNSKKKKNVTIREHLAYRIQDRAEESPTILLTPLSKLLHKTSDEINDLCRGPTDMKPSWLSEISTSLLILIPPFFPKIS
ncbi:hypothetical protein OROGR_010745 [Orobanche gracilis]